MSNILQVDPGETARSAMRGILDRGKHRLATVESGEEAWEFIQTNVKIDLVLVELQLKDGSGINLIKRLRADSQRKKIPIVVYTARGDRNGVGYAWKRMCRIF
ncbi:MAG: response regulator [Candidatus Synoicihabitans palmerolidicus]|nr:response regulator [Candidatus Synoicihabitans palmerolidicus]